MSARLLANENIPMLSIRLLREWGHDVAAVVEFGPGESDSNVMRRAVDEFTFDTSRRSQRQRSTASRRLTVRRAAGSK